MNGCRIGLHDLPEPPVQGMGLAAAAGRLQAVCLNCDRVFAVRRGLFGARWKRIAAPPWAMEGWRDNGAEPGDG